MNTTKETYAFFDIDGVLCSLDNLYASVGNHLDTKEVIRDEWGYFFDERCVRWLRIFIRRTNASIVISSTWRKNIRRLTGKTIQDIWKSRNLPGEIVGITPSIASGFRGKEINMWLRENKIDPHEKQRYVIFDDDSDFYNYQPLIKTNSDFGLTHDDIEKAYKLLTGNELFPRQNEPLTMG